MIAGLSLLVGFAAAQATELRWLGGIIVLAGAGWCVLREWRHTTAWRLGLVLVLGAVSFALAHVLAEGFGPWPSVVTSAAALAAATWVLVHDQAAAPSSA